MGHSSVFFFSAVSKDKNITWHAVVAQLKRKRSISDWISGAFGNVYMMFCLCLG